MCSSFYIYLIILSEDVVVFNEIYYGENECCLKPGESIIMKSLINVNEYCRC